MVWVTVTNKDRIILYTQYLLTKTVEGIYRLTPNQRRRVSKKAKREGFYDEREMT